MKSNWLKIVKWQLGTSNQSALFQQSITMLKFAYDIVTTFAHRLIKQKRFSDLVPEGFLRSIQFVPGSVKAPESIIVIIVVVEHLG